MVVYFQWIEDSTSVNGREKKMTEATSFHISMGSPRSTKAQTTICWSFFQYEWVQRGKPHCLCTEILTVLWALDKDWKTPSDERHLAAWIKF